MSAPALLLDSDFTWEDFLALPDDDRRELVDGVLASGFKVRVNPRRGFMPDVQVYLAGNPARGQHLALEHGHPDLAVEVISPGSGRHDRLLKRESYARIGVPEYWIIDPEVRLVERLVLRDGLYAIAQANGGDETFAPASFPGLEIPLAELWEVG